MTDIINFDKARKDILKKRGPRSLKEELTPSDYDEFSLVYALVTVRDLLDGLSRAGFTFSNEPNCMYDLITIIESTRALIHRASGLSYPQQEINQEIFEIENLEENYLELIEAIYGDDEDE